MRQNHLKKNPSRETCESVIRRILSAEIKERGKNEHFRQAADFMPYFESLYPASDGLTKQVQRAVRALALPKDEKGYFIINKTQQQVTQEQEIRRIFESSQAVPEDLSLCETVLLRVNETYCDYLMHFLTETDSLSKLYVTMVKTCNGILFYTRDKAALLAELEGFRPQ